MIQSGADLDQFLPKRVAWGIVIIVLLAVAIFVLPNLKFGGAAKREPEIGNADSYMQLLGLSKAEIRRKWGPPDSVDTTNNEIGYKIPDTGTLPGSLSKSLFLTFDTNDKCTRFLVHD